MLTMESISLVIGFAQGMAVFSVVFALCSLMFLLHSWQLLKGHFH
jgi:hypothetical protein